MSWRLLTAASLTAGFAFWRGVVGDPASDAFERWLLDLRFQIRGPWEAVDTVAVVAIDEAAAAEYPGATQRRRAIAEALPIILDGGARAVALDVIFAEATGADAELASTLAGTGRAVIAASARARAQFGDLSSPEIDAALARSAIPVVIDAQGAPPPLPSILPTARIASAARLGHVNFARSAGGALSAAPLALGVGEGRVLPALALAAAAIHLGETITLRRREEVRIGDRSIPVDRDDAIIMDHPGGIDAIPTYSLLAVLSGAVPPEAFAGRSVFVGGAGESLGDMFVTPFAPNLAGVEVNAALAAGIISGRWIARDGAVTLASGALAVLLACFAASAGRARRRGVFLAAIAAVWATGLVILQTAFTLWGVWLDGAMALAGLIAGSVAGAGDGFRALARRSARLSQERAALARFVAPGLATSLAREGGPDFDRRAQRATVLFVDVAGFTKAAETASGEALTAYLERLHEHFEAASAAHGAVITDFMGDGAMMVFGLPEPQGDDAARALACAFHLADAPPPAFGDPGDDPAGEPSAARRLALRVSLHHGPVTAAVLGGRAQSVVTVAGDTVNLAARLQEIAKEIGARIVTTRETLEAAEPDRSAWTGWRFHSHRRVRGRERTAEIWVNGLAKAA